MSYKITHIESISLLSETFTALKKKNYGFHFLLLSFSIFAVSSHFEHPLNLILKVRKLEFKVKVE